MKLSRSCSLTSPVLTPALRLIAFLCAETLVTPTLPHSHPAKALCMTPWSQWFTQIYVKVSTKVDKAYYSTVSARRGDTNHRKQGANRQGGPPG